MYTSTTSPAPAAHAAHDVGQTSPASAALSAARDAGQTSGDAIVNSNQALLTLPGPSNTSEGGLPPINNGGVEVVHDPSPDAPVAEPLPLAGGMVREGLHSIETNDNDPANLINSALGGRQWVGLSNSLAVTRSLTDSGNGYIQFVNLVANPIQGIGPARIGQPAVPLGQAQPAVVSDWVAKFEARWEETDALSNRGTPREHAVLHLTLPNHLDGQGYNIHNYEIVRTPIQEVVAGKSNRSVVDGAAGTGRTADTRALGNVLVSVLGSHTYNRQLEGLFLSVTRTDKVMRTVNTLFYFKMVYNAIMSDLYSMMGVQAVHNNVPAFPAAHIFNLGGGGQMPAQPPPGLQNVQHYLTVIQEAMASHWLILRKGLDLSAEELTLLVAVMMSTEPLAQAPAGTPELIMRYITFPTIDNFLVVQDDHVAPAQLARVPTGDEWYALARKMAGMLGEEEFLDAALHTASKMAFARLHRFYDWAAAEWTPMAADCTILFKEMPQPSFRCELSRLTESLRPGEFTETNDSFCVIEEIMETRLRLVFLRGAMIHCGWTVALKELNVTAEVLDVVLCRFLGMSPALLPNIPAGALDFVSPLHHPFGHLAQGNVRLSMMQQLAGTATQSMFNMLAPRYFEHNERWMLAGRRRAVAFPQLPGGQVRPQCIQVPLLTQWQFPDGLCFYNHFNPICMLNMIQDGRIPRNWCWLGSTINLNLTNESSTHPNVRRRGIRTELGVAWPADFQKSIGMAARYHSYPGRALNALNFYAADNAPQISIKSTDVGTTAEVDWQLVGVAPHPNHQCNMHAGSLMMNVARYPTFRLFQMEAYCYCMNWVQNQANAARERVLAAAVAHSFTSSGMDFRVLRLKPATGRDAPAPANQLGGGWADLAGAAGAAAQAAEPPPPT